MYSLIFVLVASTACQASILPLGATLVGPANPGALLKGPSAQAVLVGPDGSAITAAADAGALAAAPIAGGAVSAAVAPGLVAAPILAGPLALAGPAGIIKAGCWGLGCW